SRGKYRRRSGDAASGERGIVIAVDTGGEALKDRARRRAISALLQRSRIPVAEHVALRRLSGPAPGRGEAPRRVIEMTAPVEHPRRPESGLIRRVAVRISDQQAFV